MKQLLQRYAAKYSSLGLSSRRPLPLHRRIEQALRGRSEVCFVQVGSNDGVSGDPLHEIILRNAHWRCVFIEPVKRLFEQLQANYPSSERFAFENIAVGVSREIKKFYYVEIEKAPTCEDIPAWCDQLGSFDRRHILKHLDGRLAPYIVEIDVDCAPLADVLAKHRVTRLDLLHIDTEGFDYEVLKQVDFSVHHPAAILLEHKHLSPIVKQAAESLLSARGYELFDYGDDYLAIAGA